MTGLVRWLGHLDTGTKETRPISHLYRLGQGLQQEQSDSYGEAPGTYAPLQSSQHKVAKSIHDRGAGRLVVGRWPEAALQVEIEGS